MDTALLKQIKEQDRLFIAFIKAKQPEYLAEFKKVRNKLSCDINLACESYYENKFTHIFNDPKEVWKTE